MDSLRAFLTSGNPPAEELPELLFHYTSAEGLLGILETDSLWASHSRYLNDPSELVYASELMEEVIDARLAGCGNEAGQVLERAKEGLARLGENDFVFAASFSEVGDLLSQWRGYGEFGGGYAVGLRAWELDLGGLLRGVALRRVEYDRSRQRALVEQAIADVCREPLGRDVAVRGESLYSQLTVQAIFFKHFSFAEEREWRAVTVVDQRAEAQAVDFRSAGGVIVPYVSLDLRTPRDSGYGPIPLGRVVCGPTLQAELSRRAVTMALRAHGHTACEVELSKVPLRRREF